MSNATNNNENNNNANLIPHMLPLDVAEQVQVMRMQEETTYKCPDYYGGEADCAMEESDSASPRQPQHAVDVDCRRKMCEWSFQIMDFCRFRRQTVDIAMSYLDRFLASNSGPEVQQALYNKRDYQLVAMTCLYMAVKLSEPMEMETSFMAELSRGEYTAAEVSEMERNILAALQWRVNGPTRLTFALHFLALLPAEIRENAVAVETLVELTRFQTELATADYFFTTRRQSTAALACVMNALEALGLSGCALEAFLKTVAQFSGGMNPFSAEVQEARTRLLSAAGGSTLSVSGQVLSGSSNNSHTTSKLSSDRSGNESSPVCVSRTAAMEQ